MTCNLRRGDSGAGSWCWRRIVSVRGLKSPLSTPMACLLCGASACSCSRGKDSGSSGRLRRLCKAAAPKTAPALESEPEPEPLCCCGSSTRCRARASPPLGSSAPPRRRQRSPASELHAWLLQWRCYTSQQCGQPEQQKYTAASGLVSEWNRGAYQTRCLFVTRPLERDDEGQGWRRTHRRPSGYLAVACCV